MKTVDYWAIVKAWERSGFPIAPNDTIEDVLYSVPDWDWLVGVFSPDFKARWPEMGLVNFKPEKTDCDDYADEARTLMKRFWRKQSTQGPARGILFEGVKFVPDGSVPHKIQWTLRWMNGDWFVGLYEPQIPGPIEMSPTEKKSVWF